MTESSSGSITSLTSPSIRSESGWRKPTLEDRKLHALAVFLADLGDLSEAASTRSLGIGDIVTDKDVHRLRDDKRRIARNVATKVAGE